jgi:uncharacterized delta-60 repeat protein
MTKARPGAYRFRWAIALVSLAGLVSAQSGRCQSLDSFNPSPNFWASAIVVQADGKVIFGGGFTTVTNQARGRLARVNADGTLDATFTNPNANDDVYSLALQPDGKVLVGGDLTFLGTQNRYGIGRLNTNGTLDSSFNATGFTPAPSPPTTSYRGQAILVLADGRIIVGGRATTTLINNQTITGGFLTRLNSNGSTDNTFSGGSINGPVTSLALQPDGKILVGGLFTLLGGQTRNRIARVNDDGSLDMNFNPALTASGSTTPIAGALVVQPDGKIIVGGLFQTIAGQSQTNLARVDENGVFDNTFHPVVAGATFPQIYSIALQTDGKMLVGGLFTTLNGMSRMRAGRLNADGSTDTSFISHANLDVYGVAVQSDGKELAAGYFSQLAGQTRAYIGRLTTTNPATQSLRYDGSGIFWRRGGPSPEVWRTTFETSTDGTNWTSLGDGSRISGGWQITGVTLPAGGKIRARGWTTGGAYNSSSWFVESRLPILPLIITDDASFGVDANQMFGFNVNAPPGSTVAVDASTNLVNWQGVQTNVMDPSGQFLFHDSDSGQYANRFYRARYQ